MIVSRFLWTLVNLIQTLPSTLWWEFKNNYLFEAWRSIPNSPQIIPESFWKSIESSEETIELGKHDRINNQNKPLRIAEIASVTLGENLIKHNEMLARIERNRAKKMTSRYYDPELMVTKIRYDSGEIKVIPDEYVDPDNPYDWL